MALSLAVFYKIEQIDYFNQVGGFTQFIELIFFNKVNA